MLPNFKELTGISSKTVVNGQGIVTWLIEDSKGVRRPLSTKAYLVRNAGIRLFSPQTYFQENRNSSNDPHLRLDCSGTSLVLDCGTPLFFPLQSTSNLPIMLTETMLHSSKGTNFTSFVAGQTVFQPTQSSSIFPKYPRISPGTLPYLINLLSLDNSHIRALPKFIDRNLLSK